MNKQIKRILFGLIIWLIPFVVSIFFWDVEANAPIISMAWFSALMAFCFAIGFSIAAILWFKDVKKDSVRQGWLTGVIWYVELLILDLIVLVGLFGMSWPDYYVMLLTYLNVIVLGGAIGYIIKK